MAVNNLFARARAIRVLTKSRSNDGQSHLIIDKLPPYRKLSAVGSCKSSSVKLDKHCFQEMLPPSLVVVARLESDYALR